MKKLFYILTAALALIGCSGNTANASQHGADTTAADSNIGAGKALVVYFSHTGENYAVGNITVGNTKKIADLIATATGADQFEVVAEKSYDMPYTPLTELAKQEQERGELPAFKGELENIDSYTTIFVGGPVWWGTYPQVMFTFFKKYDLNGKTLIPFTTHEGSGLGRCPDDLKAAFPHATVLKGLAVRGADAQADKAETAVKHWLDELGF